MLRGAWRAGRVVVASAGGFEFVQPLLWPLVVGLAVTIIAVFALFEKRRSEMNAWLEDLKRWAE